LTSEEKKKLTRLITCCYEALNIYGKTPEQLESIITLMRVVLKGIPYQEIKIAFEMHLKASSTMPTPHDIIKLITCNRPRRLYYFTPQEEAALQKLRKRDAEV